MLTPEERVRVEIRRDSARAALAGRDPYDISIMSRFAAPQRTTILSNLIKQAPDSSGAAYWQDQLDAMDAIIAPTDMIRSNCEAEALR